MELTRFDGSKSTKSPTISTIRQRWRREWDSSQVASRQGESRDALAAHSNRQRPSVSEGAGGESGIRTHGRVSPTHAFQACSFNHSDISPFKWNQQFTATRHARPTPAVK